jgi:hypothetical protein
MLQSQQSPPLPFCAPTFPHLQTLQRMGGALPPQMIQQLGGMGGLQNLMKAMEGMDKPGGGRGR